jgi:hypothetical protein
VKYSTQSLDVLHFLTRYLKSLVGVAVACAMIGFTFTPKARLSAKEVKEKIIAEVRSFSGLTMQDDDMTVVVVKVK